MSDFPIAGYQLRPGSPLDRATLVKFMERNYAELNPGQPLAHIATTVERYLGRETPLWWVERSTPTTISPSAPVGCIWLGQATDQRTGRLHPYVLLLYVDVAHRRRGMATALLNLAHQWAKDQGYRQISLQVFSSNGAAQALYKKLGYTPEAILLKKSWDDSA
ncbi:MAG: GNAT family N-acetyltransferase [Nodosilinea sp.]